MKIKIISFCLLIAVIADMAFIFYNSSQTADESNRFSKTITKFLLDVNRSVSELHHDGTDDESEYVHMGASAENPNAAGDSQNEISGNDNNETKPADSEKNDNSWYDSPEIKALNSKVRKYSHAAEFLLLGFLLLLLFAVNIFTGFRGISRIQIAMISAFAVSAVYAVLDECHQIFVDGRAFEVSDILLDSVGSCSGVIFACTLFVAAFKIRAHNG